MKSKVEIISFLKENIKKFPKTGLILGSGWNKVIEVCEVEKEFDFKEVFGVKSGVAGHKGKIVIGSINSKKVLFMAGRFHTYEGYSSSEVVRPLEAFASLGIKNIIITSAAGGLNKNYKVGDLVVLNDLITLFLKSPLTGAKFQDLSTPFNLKLQRKAYEVSKKEKITLKKGVYAYVRGPHFETFADKKALKILGADMVGMSMCPEVIMANYLRLNILGLACITNLAFVKHSHFDVIKAANKVSSKMTTLINGIISVLDD
ncbi:purine-nucleoside phosphorylase [Patescibacteria group bacterium]